MVLDERIENSCMKEQLIEKVDWVPKETLKIHRKAPETRIASSLSPIDILVVHEGAQTPVDEAPFSVIDDECPALESSAGPQVWTYHQQH